MASFAILACQQLHYNVKSVCVCVCPRRGPWATKLLIKDLGEAVNDTHEVVYHNETHHDPTPHVIILLYS